MPDTYSKISFWKRLGAGSYNEVYKHKKEALVLKTQTPKEGVDPSLDNPARSVRLWNEINHDIEPAAFICGYRDKKGQLQVGWVAPYIEGRQSTDAEIAEKVKRIYQRTGRILTDACSPKNFITTRQGKVVCVDIGLAFQLEKREEQNRSFISLGAWQETAESFTSYFKRLEKSHPKTLKMIKGLLVLKDISPDFNVGNVTIEAPMWAKYAQQYQQHSISNSDWEDPKEIAYNKDKVVIEAVRFESRKNFIVNRLTQYITSRGSIDHKGEFEPSLLTQIFRNTRLTQEKVSYASKLIEKIKKASDSQQLEEALNIEQDPNKERMFKSSSLFGSDLARVVKACKFELAIIKKHEERLKQEMPPTPDSMDPSF